MSILLSPSFLIFVILVILNFVMIFVGSVGLQLLAGLFTVSLMIASLITMLGMAHARIVGFIALILSVVMGLLLAQQSGFLV